MQSEIEAIHELFSRNNDAKVLAIEKLPQAGSDRHYYRILTDKGNGICTHGLNTKENETFIYFSNHFREKGLSTPTVHYVSEDATIYIQEDFGDVSLIDKYKQEVHTEYTFI